MDKRDRTEFPEKTGAGEGPAAPWRPKPVVFWLGVR